MFKLNGHVITALTACRMIERLGKVSTLQVAVETGKSRAYVNSALKSLVKAGLLTTTSGSNGGTSFNHDKITWLEIVEAIEGPVNIAPGVDGELEHNAYLVNNGFKGWLESMHFRRGE